MTFLGSVTARLEDCSAGKVFLGGRRLLMQAQLELCEACASRLEVLTNSLVLRLVLFKSVSTTSKNSPYVYLCIHLLHVFWNREWCKRSGCKYWDKKVCSCFPRRISCSMLGGLPYWLFEAWKDDMERPCFSFLNLRWQPYCPWPLS